MVNGVKTDMVNGRLLLHPAPRSGSGGKQSRSRGASCCARGLSNSEAKTSQTTKGGGGAPKGAYQRPLRAIAASPLGGFAARAAFGGRARLPALYRGSRQSLSALAQSGPALHGSANGSLRPPPGQRAPRRPASGPAGRVSEPPANGVTNPIPGTAPARINRPSPVDVPWNERDKSLYPKIGQIVNKKMT